jgi:hypothetical protein
MFGCLSVVSVVSYQVEVFPTGRSVVQASPTDCGVSLCGIYKPREWGGSGPCWTVAPENNNKWYTRFYFCNLHAQTDLRYHTALILNGASGCLSSELTFTYTTVAKEPSSPELERISYFETHNWDVCHERPAADGVSTFCLLPLHVHTGLLSGQ